MSCMSKTQFILSLFFFLLTILIILFIENIFYICSLAVCFKVEKLFFHTLSESQNAFKWYKYWTFVCANFLHPEEKGREKPELNFLCNEPHEASEGLFLSQNTLLQFAGFCSDHIIILMIKKMLNVNFHLFFLHHKMRMS